MYSTRSELKRTKRVKNIFLATTKRTGNKFISEPLRPPVGASEHSASECRRTAHLGWSGRRPWRTRNVQHALGCRKTAFRRRRPARTHACPPAPTRSDGRAGGWKEGITKTSDARPAPKTAEPISSGERWGTGAAAPPNGRSFLSHAPPCRRPTVHFL